MSHRLQRSPRIVGIALFWIGLSFAELAMANEVASDPTPSRTARPGGFSFQEAREFIEFCVDLDSQDDRRKSPDNPAFTPSPGPWRVLYDSRAAVAADLVEWVKRGRPTEDDAKAPEHWAKLYRSAEAMARRLRLPVDSEQQVFANPEVNGFGPWDNAWVLAQSTDPATPERYVIAIRGTLFSSRPSALEDAFTQPVRAADFVVRGFSFANSEGAVVHSGMAHGAFSLLLDARYGILAQLEFRRISPVATLNIVGHSQGAGLATLVHAALDTMMANARTDPDNLFGMRDKDWRVRSYGFAQPKIGNHVFAAEFARRTQAADSAIVVNNNLDPVPLVPLTFTRVADVGDVFTGKDELAAVLHRLGNIGIFASELVSRPAERRIRGDARGYGYYYHWNPKAEIPVDEQYAWSWNFQSAGHVLYVFGEPNPDPADTFYQHHATTYRKLIAEQLSGFGAPASATDPPQGARKATEGAQ